MEDLFTMGMKKRAPLADRMRPRTLDEFYGQQHIVGKGKLLRRAIEADRPVSYTHLDVYKRQDGGIGETVPISRAPNTADAGANRL